MAELWLDLTAPFAAFRWMQAGVYRATSPVIPPSAAWGLVLNLAGIDVRGPLGPGSTTIRADAPPLDLVVGVPADHAPEVSVLYQQLHTYPVGASGKELAKQTFGAKYWIAPAKREILVGFRCVIGVRGPGAILERVRRGLAGALPEDRYGLPFAGDNNLLFDRIDVLERPPVARWYAPVAADSGPVAGAVRLTTSIDRLEASRTKTVLFAPTAVGSAPTGWVTVPTPRSGEPPT